MRHEIHWVPSSDSNELYGLIGYGFRVALYRMPDGWSIHFGGEVLAYRSHGIGGARDAAIGLVRRILTECLMNISDSGGAT